MKLEKMIYKLGSSSKTWWFIPDRAYLKAVYSLFMNKKLDLKTPKTYTEKLQWLKLNDRKREYSVMVDKYLAKQYVSNIIGENYIIPTIGVWDDPEQINFDSLPSKFVLKCTHDSGGLFICKDKNLIDISLVKNKMKESLKRNYYSLWREWPYKNVKKRVIAEQYMEDTLTGELKDYKFFTFGGKVRTLFIASDRQNPNEQTKFDFFDENFKHLDINNGHPNASVLPQKPANFELMKELAEKLAFGTKHLRVDFYEIDGKVYFGELTFFHWSGIVPFDPPEWDEKLGDWLVL